MGEITTVVQSIIMSQRDVMGPLALEQANTVSGILVEESGKVKITLKKDDSPKDLLGNLVKKYEQLFGQASIEVCKDAIRESGVKLDDKDVPDILH
jgi:hypothetical protein